MKIQESAENYLETILMLQNQTGFVRSVDIAAHMEFSKPSVSNAMKNLREGGYITMARDGQIQLTPSGLSIATQVLERHLFLVEFLQGLGVSKEVAHKDACRMEHAMSQETFEKLKVYFSEK